MRQGKGYGITSMSTLTRPALRYHGGKWRDATWIISYFPEHRRYIEPFGGGASVLLRKSRSYAEVYNDLDGEIVNLFRVLRNPSQARELIRLVEMTPFSRVEFEQAYLPDGDPIEMARRLLVRSFMGFGAAGTTGNNTGFRNNSTRSGTTPATDWANYPPALALIAERMRGVIIEMLPATEVLQRFDGPDALFYIDPPYPLTTRGKQSAAGYRYEMTDDEHRELAGVVRGLVGKIVISGYPCDLYDCDLYSDWQRVTKNAHAEGARDRIEVLWISPAAVRQPSLFCFNPSQE